MKAAVCREFGKPLVVEDIVLDPPQAGEVMVRIEAVAICHSDVHLVRGDWVNWAADAPIVAGHEAAGVVEAVGPGMTRVRPGERVVVSLLRSCGRCFYCTLGAPNMCEAHFALAAEHRLHDLDGRPINQGISTGAFAEQAVVHESQLVAVPEWLPMDRACLLACGVITGLGAVVNTARVEPGSSVVVIGTGGVGLNAVQGARLCGADPIIAVDVLDRKLQAACEFGASHTLNAQQPDAAQQVRAWTGGRGADYVFVAIGQPAAIAQALRMARRLGTVVLVGMAHKDVTAPLPFAEFVNRGQRLLGSHMGSTRLSVDVPRLVGLYEHGRLKLDELITGRYPLEQINLAIESLERGEALRNVIVLDGARSADAR
jgi:S-(hydroxymethyl)glutathione dehydrogenase/alcohol dehydrogenase